MLLYCVGDTAYVLEVNAISKTLATMPTYREYNNPSTELTSIKNVRA